MIYQKHLSELKVGEQFHFDLNQSACTTLSIEQGTNYNILFYVQSDNFSTLPFPFYVDTERDDWVWASSSEPKNVIITHITNTESNITHKAYNEYPVCGNRFNVGMTIIDDSKITCKKCLEIIK